MDDKKTVYAPRGDPLTGQKLGDLVKIITKIDTGGMCDVYLGEIDIHMYRALKIIDGTLEPQKLGLDLPKGKIEDPDLIERVKAEARNLSEKFSEITRELGDRDTTKIVQEGLLSDTHEEFRAKGNLVAVKVLQQNYAKDLQDNTEIELKKKRRIRERFIKEGKTLKRLNHPNIIKSIEAGYDEIGPEKMPVYFYVMEYVEKYQFSKHDAGNPLPTETAVKIGKAVLVACDYIHKQDPPILHRDIKPSNILVDEETIDQEEIDARLTDLGFAKIRDEGSSASAPKDISQSQEFAGTPNYVAPEQAQGLGTATSASDIWSIAATLHELLTGHAPYEAEENAGFAVLSKILECARPESMRKYNPNIPQMLEDIILMNFTKKQEDRLCPAKEFICALDDYTRISKKDNTAERIKENIKEKEKILKKSKDKKSEELAELYYELLYKTERKIIEGLPDQSIIRDRMAMMGKLIEKTTTSDENRINFLKKYKKYEETFLIKKDPSTAAELPKKRSKLGLAITAAAIILLGTIGWFVADTYQRHSAISRTHRSIKVELITGELNINSNDLDAVLLNLRKIRAERSNLPKDFNSELDQRISSLENNYTQKKNEKIYAESRTAISAAYAAFSDRTFAKAKTDADIAEKKIKQLAVQDSDEYKSKQAEIEKEIAELRTKLAGKDESIRTFDFVKESYERIKIMYESFRADLEKDKLFDKKEIDLLRKKIETHKNTLVGVEEEFQDENKSLLPEYVDLEEKIDELNENISILGRELAEKQYFADLNKKAGEGDENAQQIISLEKKIKEKSVYIKDGMTTEYLDDLKTTLQDYLSGKNMRGDTKISMNFDEIIQKLPQFKEKKEELEKQTRPLSDLSWKIESLGAELEHNPESKETKEAYDTAVAEFSQKAQEQTKNFTDLEEEIRKYIMTDGIEITNPRACLNLGREYERAGEKERAVKAYKKFIEAGKKYIAAGGCDFLTDEEEIKDIEKSIELLEQK